MHEWRSLRDEYLRAVVRLEGPGDASEEVCPSCQDNVPTLRCRHCFGGQLYCRECCLEMHAKNPLRVIGYVPMGDISPAPTFPQACFTFDNALPTPLDSHNAQK
ncbi:hypothetical protein C8F04DRAFT_1098322 [Mycena alexandri]|uniref:Uncharacterized protein n=1 Tax=Mycena alexandri TaxID=1745969 RepID=A0AAD6X1H5_9AGAR|nr:hypothetical protein C8F04DRAFT_1098322 [Mycena alexandri]